MKLGLCLFLFYGLTSEVHSGLVRRDTKGLQGDGRSYFSFQDSVYSTYYDIFHDGNSPFGTKGGSNIEGAKNTKRQTQNYKAPRASTLVDVALSPETSAYLTDDGSKIVFNKSPHYSKLAIVRKRPRKRGFTGPYRPIKPRSLTSPQPRGIEFSTGSGISFTSSENTEKEEEALGLIDAREDDTEENMTTDSFEENETESPKSSETEEDSMVSATELDSSSTKAAGEDSSAPFALPTSKPTIPDPTSIILPSVPFDDRSDEEESSFNSLENRLERIIEKDFNSENANEETTLKSTNKFESGSEKNSSNDLSDSEEKNTSVSDINISTTSEPEVNTDSVILTTTEALESTNTTMASTEEPSSSTSSDNLDITKTTPPLNLIIEETFNHSKTTTMSHLGLDTTTALSNLEDQNENLESTTLFLSESTTDPNRGRDFVTITQFQEPFDTTIKVSTFKNDEDETTFTPTTISFGTPLSELTRTTLEDFTTNPIKDFTTTKAQNFDTTTLYFPTESFNDPEVSSTLKNDDMTTTIKEETTFNPLTTFSTVKVMTEASETTKIPIDQPTTTNSFTTTLKENEALISTHKTENDSPSFAEHTTFDPFRSTTLIGKDRETTIFEEFPITTTLTGLRETTTMTPNKGQLREFNPDKKDSSPSSNINENPEMKDDSFVILKFNKPVVTVTKGKDVDPFEEAPVYSETDITPYFDENVEVFDPAILNHSEDFFEDFGGGVDFDDTNSPLTQSEESEEDLDKDNMTTEMVSTTDPQDTTSLSTIDSSTSSDGIPSTTVINNEPISSSDEPELITRIPLSRVKEISSNQDSTIMPTKSTELSNMSPEVDANEKLVSTTVSPTTPPIETITFIESADTTTKSSPQSTATPFSTPTTTINVSEEFTQTDSPFTTLSPMTTIQFQTTTSKDIESDPDAKIEEIENEIVKLIQIISPDVNLDTNELRQILEVSKDLMGKNETIVDVIMRNKALREQAKLTAASNSSEDVKEVSSPESLMVLLENHENGEFHQALKTVLDQDPGRMANLLSDMFEYESEDEQLRTANELREMISEDPEAVAESFVSLIVNAARSSNLESTSSPTTTHPAPSRVRDLPKAPSSLLASMIRFIRGGELSHKDVIEELINSGLLPVEVTDFGKIPIVVGLQKKTKAPVVFSDVEPGSRIVDVGGPDLDFERINISNDGRVVETEKFFTSKRKPVRASSPIISAEVFTPSNTFIRRGVTLPFPKKHLEVDSSNIKDSSRDFEKRVSPPLTTLAKKSIRNNDIHKKPETFSTFARRDETTTYASLETEAVTFPSTTAGISPAFTTSSSPLENLSDSPDSVEATLEALKSNKLIDASLSPESMAEEEIDALLTVIKLYKKGLISDSELLELSQDLKVEKSTQAPTTRRMLTPYAASRSDRYRPSPSWQKRPKPPRPQSFSESYIRYPRPGQTRLPTYEQNDMYQRQNSRQDTPVMESTPDSVKSYSSIQSSSSPHSYISREYYDPKKESRSFKTFSYTHHSPPHPREPFPPPKTYSKNFRQY